MKALLQRVRHAKVEVAGEVVGEIASGLLVFIAVEPQDGEVTVKRMADKLLGYRVFEDGSGRMNQNLQQVAGELLLVPQFTLAADTAKGLRPSFSSCAAPERARELYHALETQLKVKLGSLEAGRYGADMQVYLCNAGPATFLLSL